MKLSQQLPADTVKFNLEKPSKPAVTPSLTLEQVAKLQEIKTRAGWIAPQHQVALAKGNATTQAIDAVATMTAKQMIDMQGSQEEDGNWFAENVYNPIKATARWGFAGLNFVPEFVQGGLAQWGKPGDTMFQDGWFAQTSIGSMLKASQGQAIDPRTGQRVDNGEGWFTSEGVLSYQGKKAREYRGTINGSAWTVGRAAANLVFKPKSIPYNVLSGFLDAAVMVKLDPTGPVTKGIKAATKGGLAVKGVDVIQSSQVPLLSATELAPLRAALESESGLVKGLGDVSLDGTKWDSFTRTNRRMKTLIDRVAAEPSARVIAEDIFDHKLPNEIVGALADARDPEQVRAILAAGWGIGKGALPDDIRLIQGNRLTSKIGELVVQRMPLVDGVRKSRYFTKMADAKIIVNGDINDNRNAVKTIISYLRTAGVDRETADTITNSAIRSFTANASDVARKQTMDMFHSTMRAVMKQDGITDEAIDQLYSRTNDGVENIRRYMQNRVGESFDGKYSSYLTNKNRDFIPEEEIETLLAELGFEAGDQLAIVSPTELVEMLDRVQVLPSLREVRRITRSKLFRDVLGDKELLKKVPLTAKREKRLITVITDQKEFDRLGAEVARLRKIKAKTPDMKNEIEDLLQQQARLKVKEYRRIITPEQRAAVNALDYMQNQLWKPLALATGGYVVRNSLDAQVRMAFSELPSVFTHPFEYMNLVLGTSKRMSLKLENLAKLGTTVDEKTLSKLGSKIDELKAITTPTPRQTARLQKLEREFEELMSLGDQTIDEALEDLANELSFGKRKQGLGGAEIDDHMERSGSFENANRGEVNGLERHTDAVAQNGYRTFNDPFRKVAVQTFVEYGGDTQTAREQAARRIVNIIRKNKKLQNEVDDLHQYGFTIINSRTGAKAKTPPIDLRGLTEEDQIAAYYQYAMRISVENGQLLTGGLPEIQFMYAFNRVPKYVDGEIVPRIERTISELTLAEGDQFMVGAIVQLDDDQIGVITKISDDFGDVLIDPLDGSIVDFSKATIQPVEAVDAFGRGEGSAAARRIIKKQELYDERTKVGLPPTLKRELMQTSASDQGKLASFQDSYDKSVDWFFNSIVNTITTKLERNPVFRQYYYEEVGKLIDRLNPAQAEKFLVQVEKKAAALKIKPEEYLGDKEILQKMRASTKTAGDVTIEELDDYAKYVAVNNMKELLYDASSRSNLQDALRIIMPFAPAWREVIGTYAGFLKKNPVGTARSFQRIYTGISNADPDNDGRGFFYHDPTTNELMFTFPGSGTLSKVLTGLDATLEAPVSRLSQGIQAFPALGPVAQIAASQILRDTPDTDFLREIFLPYGNKGIRGLAPYPGWVEKFTSAIVANEDDLNGIFANTYIETLRALSASGDYDLDSREEVRQLQEDAKFKARILTGFRAFSQFAGPTAGTTEFKVKTDEGDVFVSSLVKEFYDMQADPRIGYDKALPMFLQIYGDEMALYVGAKSRSLVEGLEATEEFGQWEGDNKGLIEDYPEVARYFAPAGSDFSFAVYDRQRRSGLREKLTDDELIKLAQQRIGSAKYREAREQVGPYPSDSAKDVLKRYRTFLSKKYPGFPEFAEFQVGKYYNDVADLKQIVFDNRVAETGVGKAVREYLLAREQAIAASGSTEQGFRQAKGAARLRDGLASLGLALSKQEPNFARIFDRLLASEVE
jgi:hypothetical protein